MGLKDKMKTYNFWISLASAAVLIARIIGDKFNFFVDTSLIMDITTGLCSIFVILGILSVPKSTQTKVENNQKTKEETQSTETSSEPSDESITNDSANTESTETFSTEEQTNKNNNHYTKEEIQNPSVEQNSQTDEVVEAFSSVAEIIISGEPNKDDVLKQTINNLNDNIKKASLLIEQFNKQSN